MKEIKWFVILMLGMQCFFYACENDKQAVPVKKERIEEVNEQEIEEVVDDLLAEKKDGYPITFESAIGVFEEEDYTIAAEYIERTTADLMKKSKGLNDTESERLMKRVQKLNVVAKDLTTGKWTNADTVINLFSTTEMAMAYEYMLLCKRLVIIQPRESRIALQHAVTRIRNATDNLEGAALKEGTPLLKNAKVLLNTSDFKTDKSQTLLEVEIVKLSDWIKKYGL